MQSLILLQKSTLIKLLKIVGNDLVSGLIGIAQVGGIYDAASANQVKNITDGLTVSNFNQQEIYIDKTNKVVVIVDCDGYTNIVKASDLEAILKVINE